jgi:hypothetical protein
MKVCPVPYSCTCALLLHLCSTPVKRHQPSTLFEALNPPVQPAQGSGLQQEEETEGPEDRKTWDPSRCYCLSRLTACLQVQPPLSAAAALTGPHQRRGGPEEAKIVSK